MRDDPGIEIEAIIGWLRERHGVDAASVAFLPAGYDFGAAAYRIEARDGARFFLKARFAGADPAALAVPRLLANRGAPNIVAPLPGLDGMLATPLPGLPASAAILYPFIPGEEAMTRGLTLPQWAEFGAALRAVHDSGLEREFRGRIPEEGWDLPSADAVDAMWEMAEAPIPGSPAAAAFAAFLRRRRARIARIVARARALGRACAGRELPLVLCHADIHAANVIAGDDGRPWLIDWDYPKIAPRERDLLFIVGSRIARRVERREERAFFAGYGPAAVDPDALRYFRYERIVEDIGSFAETVLRDPAPSEDTRAEAAATAMALFARGADIDRAERVSDPRPPARR